MLEDVHINLEDQLENEQKAIKKDVRSKAKDKNRWAENSKIKLGRRSNNIKKISMDSSITELN